LVEKKAIPLVRTPDGHCEFARTRAGEPTQVRVLHLACLILGGLEPLAKHLDVRSDDLLKWLKGSMEPPNYVFLAAVEILLLDAEKYAPRA
jgi:hypothetical protein